MFRWQDIKGLRKANLVDTFKISKVINAPLKFVYEWCTDFSEDDPKITGESSKRTILEKTRKRAVYVESFKGHDGKKKLCVDIVSFDPPDSWHMEQFGEEDNETGDYKLVRLGREKTKLNMTFKEIWKEIAEIPSTRELISNSEGTWDRYVTALEKEYLSRMKLG